MTADRLDLPEQSRPRLQEGRSRLAGLGLLGPEPPDMSVIGSVAEGRVIVDELDDLIRDVIVLRRRVAGRIQTLRMASGGGRIEIGREHEVTGRFLEALGPDGGELAVALLLLCRGPAPSLDLPVATAHDVDHAAH